MFFGNFTSCKPKQKNRSSELIFTSKEEKDTIPKYPNYLTKEYVLGKFDYTKNLGFKVVPKQNSTKKIYLRKEVLVNFLLMKDAAAKDEIVLKIISGTRNFKHQKRIWNYKWNEKYNYLTPLNRVIKILEYSAMPSTSRHHWGTDLDLNSLNNAYFLNGKGKATYNWLQENASKFGFYQVYTSKKTGRKGYNEEKWHWSYLPLSSIYLNYYNTHITQKDITNFEGQEFFTKLNIIKNYVNGINEKILKLKP
ncbi:D-alanyl-D-alanine carboxypeptidase [Polaribacter sp. ALD11]|nr:D-alanyl-D-alanine carboxypeptidase [Polaribacter sp. ALD11]